jgi:hypothetical protein
LEAEFGPMNNCVYLPPSKGYVFVICDCSIIRKSYF